MSDVVCRSLQYTNRLNYGVSHDLDDLALSKFLICNQCDFVKELDDIVDFTPVTISATTIQFEIINYTVEIKGLCVNCKSC